MATSKNRRKALQDAVKKRQEFESWNGELAGIADLKDIQKRFKTPQECSAYLKAVTEQL